MAAAEGVTFALTEGADVEVLGWPELAGDAAKGQWISDLSDHAVLRYTVLRFTVA